MNTYAGRCFAELQRPTIGTQDVVLPIEGEENRCGTNVADELGLTESNSRIFGAVFGTGGVLLARPLEGSEINIQAKYRW